MGTRPRKFVWERVPAYMGDERVPVHSGGSVPGNLGGNVFQEPLGDNRVAAKLGEACFRKLGWEVVPGSRGCFMGTHSSLTHTLTGQSDTSRSCPGRFPF